MGTKTQPPDRLRAVRERIRKNFDRGAEAYERFEERSAHFRDLTRELLAMAPGLEGRRVLDVGCGTGASTRLLLEAVGPAGMVVGIDISLGMLRVAKYRHPRGCYVQADACRLDAVLRGPFDAVVYNAVLFMLPDAEGSLIGAARLLQPEGVILASHLEGVYRASDRRPVTELLADKGLPVGRHALSAWDTVCACLADRFQRVETRRVEIRLDPERFLGFYGVEPMSAGLLPRMSYPDRLREVEALAREWEAAGEGAVQVWHLACGQEPQAEPEGM